MSLRTLNDVFFAVVERQHPRVMLEQLGDEWGAISSDALRRRVAAVAGGLRSCGIGRGDRVAILSENRPEWTIADFASLLLGAATVPIYATLTADQTAYILRDSGARVIFVSSEMQLQKVLSIRDQTALEKLVVMDACENPGAMRMAEMEPDSPAHHDAALEATARAVSADDLATIIYTSGTTGTPKGVMLSHVKASVAIPDHTNPQNFLSPRARSPAWMRAAIVSNSSQLPGGRRYPYLCNRSLR